MEVVFATGVPMNKPWVKLLGHDGAIIANTEEEARNFMKEFEKDQENFGKN